MFRINKSFKPVLQKRPSFGAILILALTINGLIVVAGGVRRASAYNQDLDKLNQFVQTSNSPDAEKKLLSEGRDEIADENWEEAQARFTDYIRKYPKGKDVDAATYWLAFSLKKQEQFQDADRRLEQLIAQFPASKWKKDAEAMRIEIGPYLNRQTPTTIEKGDVDTQIMVLQSIFQGSPERGAAIAADILRNPQKDRRLREAAV